MSAVAWPQRLHRLAVDEDVAGVDLLKPRDGTQCRRLAARRRAEQDHELLVRDRQVQLPDDVVVGEVFFDVASYISAMANYATPGRRGFDLEKTESRRARPG
jgi:hypothetical protein